MGVLGIIIQSAEVETIMLPVEFNTLNVLISILITLSFTLINKLYDERKKLINRLILIK